jgi:FeoB-associated Cys-rich membrane protein
MRGDTILALLIVALAAGYLIGRAVRKSRARKAQGPGCDNCAH